MYFVGHCILHLENMNICLLYFIVVIVKFDFNQVKAPAALIPVWILISV